VSQLLPRELRRKASIAEPLLSFCHYASELTLSFAGCWYKRSELGLRLAIFFANAALAGSFGGLLAAAIARMAGLGGKGGWAWIFILEGLATMLVGACSWWFVHDWPETARFLTPEERSRVKHRLATDHLSQLGAGHDKRHVKEALRDWKLYAYAVAGMGNFMPLYAFSLFLPSKSSPLRNRHCLMLTSLAIVAGMGYTGTHAQLLTVPPYAAAAAMTIFIGWFADRTRQRGLCNMATCSIAIAGFAMLLASKKPHIQYAGTFLGK
jgi:MFS family permease